jgi:hypothetical protein
MFNPDSFQLWLRFFLGIVAFWVVFLTIVFRLEKRTVSPYGELESVPFSRDTTGYAARWVADAVQAGFVFLGWARDTRGSTYRFTYALLVSADRTTFMVISVGTILNIPMQGTWLHTPAMDGRSFNTTDKQAGVQIDLSRNWTNQLALVAPKPQRAPSPLYSQPGVCRVQIVAFRAVSLHGARRLDPFH